MKKIVLASNSPRRKELLSALGYNFDIMVSDYEEKVFSSDPIEIATTFALGKAKDVFMKIKNKGDYIVIGADTVVFLDGEILGKAKDEQSAYKTLKKLSGKTHTVITGFAILTNEVAHVDYDLSKVTFANLSEEQINAYLQSGLYKGKAGCYGIQDGFSLVEKHLGSLNNIIGLPTEKITIILKELIR